MEKESADWLLRGSHVCFVGEFVEGDLAVERSVTATNDILLNDYYIDSFVIYLFRVLLFGPLSHLHTPSGCLLGGSVERFWIFYICSLRPPLARVARILHEWFSS